MTPRTEPVAIGALAVAFAQAVLVALTALGLWSLTDVQQAALMGVVTTGVALGTAVVVRRRVTPLSTVGAEQGSDGLVAGPASPLPDGTPVDVEPRE